MHIYPETTVNPYVRKEDRNYKPRADSGKEYLKKSVWGKVKKNKVSEDDLIEGYPYQMTNFEIKAILNVNRPLKFLYSTHNPPEEDIHQHATCSVKCANKGI